MRYNKRLILVLGLSAILLVGSIFTFTSCSKKPSEDTNTSTNKNSEDENNTVDNKADDETSSEVTDTDNNNDINETNDNDTENSNSENNGNSSSNNSNSQTNENANTDNNKDDNNDKTESSNTNNNNSNNNNNSTNNSDNNVTAPDKSEENTNNSTGNMEINKEGIYAVDNNYFKSIYPLDEKSVLKAATYMDNLQKTYLTKNNKVFYAIIPDKTYYDDKSSYDKLDYDKMTSMLNDSIKDMEYIKLHDLLSLEDYYKTDNHWKQENLIDVANRIGDKLGFKINASDFEKNTFVGLKGMYSKYIVDENQKEDLKYLTNSHTTKATVDNYQHKDSTSVYDVNRLNGEISYDVFLSGATPFLTITNPNVTAKKELVIFRDSYASSLAPLLVSEYKRITLIDTRYMASILLNDFIEFSDQDVLFLYSSALINNSSILK